MGTRIWSPSRRSNLSAAEKTEMSSAQVFEELQKVLRNAKPQQLSSHSTIAAAEQLLKCLQRDGATAAHPSTPSTSAKPGSNYSARNTETQMQGSSWSSAF